MIQLTPDQHELLFWKLGEDDIPTRVTDNEFIKHVVMGKIEPTELQDRRIVILADNLL